MALIAHWVAFDAGGSGSTLPNRIDGADDGTLSGGCSWDTVGGEAVVRCPSADYVEVPDRAYWTLLDYTLIARVHFYSASGVPGILSHSTGAGGTKWVWQYGHTVGGMGVHINPGNITINGTTFTLATQLYSLAVGRQDSDSAIDFYRDGADDDGGGLTLADFPDPAATLKLGWGGEAFFNSDVGIATMRIYDTKLTGAAIFAAMTQDALDAAGASASGFPTIYYAQQRMR